ncbi:MAG TPA: cytochrome c biogenesis CcdA family protein [Gemmatimonadales bacterium]|nr:cytochrome c biogenesis CcdA family protein [Gemmatimonadales bacterium]
MSEPAALGFLVAFVAGLLSFLSPCVLPLVPSYLGFLTGMTLPEVTARRHQALLHALLFVAGFSLIFILLGASATALGRALNYYQIWLQRVGGVLIILFGLLCLGLFNLRLLSQERRLQLDRKPMGYLGSALVGMAFAAGWTPCIGPVLGGILGLAATSADVSRGMALLAAYSAGLALPFLIAAVAIEWFLAWFQRFRRFLPWVMRISGGLLVLVGLLLVTGEFTRLAGWLQSLTPNFLREQL